MSRTEKSIIRIKMDDVAAYGNAVVSCTEQGNMGWTDNIESTLEFMCHGGL